MSHLHPHIPRAFRRLGDELGAHFRIVLTDDPSRVTLPVLATLRVGGGFLLLCKAAPR